jgi:hypothetical protein
MGGYCTKRGESVKGSDMMSIYADIDPPDHYVPNRGFHHDIYWCNVVTRMVFTWSYTHGWIWWGSIDGLSVGDKMREIMGL